MGAIKVGMADYKTGNAPDTLITLGLGSCIGIVIYDPRKKSGGMAHIMLPKNPNPDKRSPKFADNAIEDMMKELIKDGHDSKRLIAKIAGGAQMFNFKSSNEMNSIGSRNAEAVKLELKKHGIRIVAEDTGGKSGRTIEMDLETGKLRIKTIGTGESYI